MNRKKYNVLFIMSDQQRRDSLGCYGNKQVQTPHIDALAAQGMRFDHAYTPLSVCSPARASVLTGLYPHSHGAVDNAAPIDRNAITIPDALIPQRMVREKCWKFIYNRSEIGELYDTENDPQERWNLFEDPQYDPIKKRLMKKLLDHMERTNDPLTWWYKSVIDTY